MGLEDVENIRSEEMQLIQVSSQTHWGPPWQFCNPMSEPGTFHGHWVLPQQNRGQKSRLSVITPELSMTSCGQAP